MSYQPTIEDKRVGFGLRLGAWAIDQVALWFVTITLVLIISSIQPGQTEFMKESLKELLASMKAFGFPRDVMNEALPYLVSMLYAGFILYWSIHREADTEAAYRTRRWGCC
jgi:hypothetical protein